MNLFDISTEKYQSNYTNFIKQIQSFAFELDIHQKGYLKASILNDLKPVNNKIDHIIQQNQIEPEIIPQKQLSDLFELIIEKYKNGKISELKSFQSFFNIIYNCIQNTNPNKADALFKIIQKLLYQLIYLMLLDRQNFGEEHCQVLKGIIACKRIIDINIILMAEYIYFTMNLDKYRENNELIVKYQQFWDDLDKLHLTSDIINSVEFKYHHLIYQLVQLSFEILYSELQIKQQIISTVYAQDQNQIQQKEESQGYFNVIFKFSEADSLFFRQYLQLIKQYILRDYTNSLFYKQIMKIPIKIWELNLHINSLTTFLTSLMNNQYAVKINQMKEIIRNIIQSNIINLFQQNLDILPSFSFLGPQTEERLFIGYFKYMRKRIQKKKGMNMQLFNTILELRIKNPDSQRINKYLDKKTFLNYFEESINWISDYNIRIIHECSNLTLKRDLLNIIIRMLKQKKNLNANIIQKYLFIKIANQTTFQIFMEIVLTLHTEEYDLHFIEGPYQFAYPTLILRQNLRKNYNSHIIPYYKSNKKNLSYKNILMLIQIESALQEENLSDEIQDFRELIYPYCITQALICEDLFIIFKKISKKTSMLMLFYSIFFVSVNQKKIVMLKQILTEINQRFGESQYELINLYQGSIFRQILYVYNLKAYQNEKEILRLLEQILLKWIPYIEVKQICFLFESAKFQFLSHFFKQKIKFLKYLLLPNFSKMFSNIESRFVNFLKFYLRLLAKYDCEQFKQFTILRNGYLNSISFKERSNNSFKERSLNIESTELNIEMLVNRYPSLRYTIIRICLNPFVYEIDINNPKQIIVNIEDSLAEKITFPNIQSIKQKLHINIQSTKQKLILKLNKNIYELKKSNSESIYKLRIQTSHSIILKASAQINSYKYYDTSLDHTVNNVLNDKIKYENGSSVESQAKVLNFSLHENYEMHKYFVMKANQITNLTIGKIKVFLEIKYLFALFHQMLQNLILSGDNQKNFSFVFELFYEIAFFKMSNSQINEEKFISTLEIITKSIIQKTQFANINVIQKILINELQKKDRQSQVVYKFVIKILLNFEIWIKLEFSFQIQIMQLLNRLMKVQKFLNKCIELKAIFQKILQINYNYFKISEIQRFKETKNAQKLKFQKISAQVLMKLTNKQQTENIISKLDYLSILLYRLDISQSKQNFIFQFLFQNILESFFQLDNVQSNQLSRQTYRRGKTREWELKQKIIEFYKKNKHFGNMFKFVINKKLRLLIFKSCFRVIRYLDDQSYSKLIKNMFQNITLEEYLQIYENLKTLLAELNASINKKEQYKYNYSIIELLCIFVSKYPDFSQKQEQIREEIQAIIIIYTQGYEKIDSNQMNQSIPSIKFQKFCTFFIRPSSISFLLYLIQKRCSTALKIEKVIYNYFQLVFQLSKQLSFEFLMLYRRLAGRNINLLLTPLKQIYKIDKKFKQNSKSEKRIPVYLQSLLLQYCFEILIVINTDVNQQQKISILNTLVDFIVKIILNQKGDTILTVFNTLPKIGYPTFKAECIKKFENNKLFEIKCGVFYKLILVIFKLWELYPSIRLIQILKLIYFNPIEGGLIKQISNYKKSVDQSPEGNQQFNLMREIIKKANQYQRQIFNDLNKEELFQQSKKKNISIENYCLEFTFLKIHLILSENLIEKPLLVKLQLLSDELIKHYATLKMQKQYILFEIKSDKILFSYENFVKRIPKGSQIQPQENIIEKPQEQKSKIDNYKKLLILQYLYTYLIKKSILNQYKQQQQEDIFVKKNIERTSKDNKNFERQNILTEQQNNQWKKFIADIEKQDGQFFQEKFKKCPVMKQRNIELPDMSKPITTLTEAYQYEIETQSKLDNNTRYSIYHSIVKKQSFFFNTDMKAGDPVLQVYEQEFDNPNTIHSFRCELIKRLGAYFCQLQINQKEKCITIRSLDQKRPQTNDYVFGVPSENLIIKKYIKKLINFSNIIQIQTRKFNQILNCAIEIFMKNGKSYYIMFYSKQNVAKFFKTIKKFFQNDELVIDCAETFKKRKYTERWQNNQLSNFEYLMIINRFASRSYNDTSQGYIFPWVLNNYKSQSIDLLNPNIYRDLSLPVAALNPKKIFNFRLKLKMQTHLYNIFFSSSMILFYYLIRIEPYTSLARTLQGARFDIADRIFSSIPNVWDSVNSQFNQQDLKQLIPQFYYLPTFLTNSNNITLGYNQANQKINHVQLPAWAHNDPNRFISIMRAALQSDFVSERLPQWINLIFGIQQFSPQRNHTFKPLYYQQNIKDYKSIQADALQDNVKQVYYFGQFPAKIFKKLHPQKKKSFGILNMRFSSFFITEKQKQIKQLFTRKNYVQEMFLLNKKIYFKRKTDGKGFKYYTLDNKFKQFQDISDDIIQNDKQIKLVKTKYELLYLETKQKRITQNGFKFEEVILKSVFLKKLGLHFEYKKVRSGNRLIAFCGKTFRLLDFEGNQYFNWNKEATEDCSFLKNGCAFTTCTGKIYKYHYTSQVLQLIYTHESSNMAEKYDIKFVAFTQLLVEYYILVIDKKKVIVIIKNQIL